MRILLVTIVMFGATAQAAIQDVSMSSPLSGTGVEFVAGSVTESTCSGPCNRTQTINVAKDMASFGIMMSAYRIIVLNGNGAQVRRIKLAIEATSYNPTTGDLDFNISADVDIASFPVDYTFNVYFVVVLGDNSSVKVGQYTKNSFTGNGLNGECDTTGACIDTSPLPDAGAGGGLNFSRAMLRGFDISTVSGNDVPVADLALDVSLYSGNINPNGTATCFLGSNVTEEISCELKLMSLARTAGSLYPVQTSDSNLGANGFDYLSMNIDAPLAGTSSNGVIGVSSVTATPDTAIKFEAWQAGCAGWSYSPTPGTGRLTTQTNYGLADPGTMNNYDATMKCVGVFLP